MIAEDTEKRFYFPELDGLRFLAFFLVFIHHHPFFGTQPFLTYFKAYGWIGVDLFFVLSAFLFSKLLVREHTETNKISFRKFYVRRFFRIWPIYFLFVFVIILYLLFITRGLAGNETLRIIGLLTFTDNIMTTIQGYNTLPFSQHLWTISYEEQFYLFIPFIILSLLKMNKRRKIILLIAVIAVFNLIRFQFIATGNAHPAVWVLPFTHFEAIICGIVIGFGGYDFLLKIFRPLVISALGIIFFLGLAFLPSIVENSYWLAVNYTFVGLSTSLFLFGTYKSKTLKNFFSKQPLVYLGKRSYGLYLYHIAAIELTAYLLNKAGYFANNQLISFIFALIITIIISIVSYRFIEKPFLKLKKRYEVIESRPI